MNCLFAKTQCESSVIDLAKNLATIAIQLSLHLPLLIQVYIACDK